MKTLYATITSVICVDENGKVAWQLTTEQVAALREAGEKMKAALEYIQEVEDLWGKSYDKSNAALAEWEAANK